MISKIADILVATVTLISFSFAMSYGAIAHAQSADAEPKMSSKERKAKDLGIRKAFDARLKATPQSCTPRYCRDNSDCTQTAGCGTCWASLCGPAP